MVNERRLELTSVLLLLLFVLFALDDAGVRDILRDVVGVAGSRRAEAEPAPLGVEGTEDVPETSGREERGGRREGKGRHVTCCFHVLLPDQAARRRKLCFSVWLSRLAHLRSLACPPL